MALSEFLVAPKKFSGGQKNAEKMLKTRFFQGLNKESHLSSSNPKICELFFQFCSKHDWEILNISEFHHLRIKYFFIITSPLSTLSFQLIKTLKVLTYQRDNP